MNKENKNNSVGSAILALAGMLGRSYGKQVQGRSVNCQISLEKAGMIRPIAERAKDGITLSTTAVRHFNKLAKDGDEGAAKVVQMHKDLKQRHLDIKAYKASQNEAPAAE